MIEPIEKEAIPLKQVFPPLHVGRTAFLFQGITIAQGRPTLLPPKSTKAEQ